MEIGCFGGIHYQGTQLHQEIVVAISNCHLLHYKRQRSYFEGKMCTILIICTSVSLRCRLSHLHIRCNLKDLCDSFERKVLCGLIFLNNRGWKKAMSHCESWQTSPAASQMKTCCKERKEKKKKVGWNRSRSCAAVSTSKRVTLNRNI